MTELVCLHYSPWSEKARFALDHHEVDYRHVEYVPMLGEPMLRARMRRLRGSVSVPVLFDRKRVYDDSYRIAKHADDVGVGASLFGTRDADILRWNDVSESALAACRALVVDRTLRDTEALEEALPAMIPSPARGGLRSVATLGAHFLRRKYATTDLGAARATLVSALETIRGELGGREYLLGDAFSYADISIAVVLQAVDPVTDEYMRIGAGTRRVWSDPPLADRFADLVSWRDRIYEKHRS